MKPSLRNIFCAAVCASVFFLGVSGCKTKAENPQPTAKDAPFMSAVTTAPPPAAQNPADEAPAPDKTEGFDGQRAFAQVAKQVSFGPRPSGSPSLAQTQDYLLTELKSYGCTADVDAFSSDTPAGRIAMKNILVKIPDNSFPITTPPTFPSESPMPKLPAKGIILLGTHYDTKRLENFVGADDAGSSTGVMLELARLLCS